MSENYNEQNFGNGSSSGVPDVENARRAPGAQGQYPGQQYGYNPQPQYPGWQQPDRQQGSNGMGITGFVLSLVAMFTALLPGVNFIVWLLGLIFSCIGLRHRPRGLAVAGLVISLIPLVLLIVVLFAVFAVGFNAGWLEELVHENF